MRYVHGGVDTAESATLTAEDVSAYAERAAPNINARGSCGRVNSGNSVSSWTCQPISDNFDKDGSPAAVLFNLAAWLIRCCKDRPSSNGECGSGLHPTTDDARKTTKKSRCRCLQCLSLGSFGNAVECGCGTRLRCC